MFRTSQKSAEPTHLLTFNNQLLMSKNDSFSKPKYQEVRSAILKWVRENSTFTSDYARWYVGVTKNPSQRQAAHNSKMPNGTLYWKHFYVASSKIASDLETELHINYGFLETDKKGNIQNDSKYIYVFKKHPTIVDAQ